MTLSNLDHSDHHPQRLEPVPPPWSYPPNYYYPYEEEEINLLDYWRVLMKRKWQILLLTFLATALAIGASIIMPKKYKAEATLMPITSSNSGGGGLAAMASQIGSIPGMGALGDLGKLGGGKTKELVNILKSTTLTEKIINRFDLLKVIFAKQYDPKTNTFFEGFPKFLKPVPVMEDGVNAFKKKYTEIEEDKKTGLVKIAVTMKNPELAAKVTNTMIVELQEFIEANSLTTAKRNRIFIEEQLVKIKTKLLEAGKELNQFYGDNKISSVVPQLDVDVGSYQMVPKPFEEFREDFGALDKQQKDVEAAKESARVRGVPGQVYLQFLTLNRELLGKTFALLTQQYEFAKIEEAKEDLAFQVIDKAEVKVRPSSPKLILNIAVGFVGGFFIAVFIAFFREYIEKMKEKEAKK
jgi:uncharacterized protein involved in exopolysaccharide biosynthesis